MLRPILAACLAALASPAMAELSDCDADAFAYAVTVNPDWHCAEIGRRTVQTQGGAVTVRAVRGTMTPAEQVGQHAERALDAIETAVVSLDHYAAEFGWQFGDVSLVLTDPTIAAFEPHQFSLLETAFADAQGFTFADECIIRLNVALLDGESLDFFDAAMAHEFAHCAQAWSYAIPDVLGGPVHSWWAESTASLFQDMTVPDAGMTEGMAKGFNKRVETRPLTQQPYTGIVFFAWVAQHHRDRLPALLHALAASPSEAGHQAVLAATFKPSEIAEFAEAIVDGTVVMPSGLALPPMPPPAQTILVAGEGDTYPVPEAPFTLMRRGLDLAAGTYRLSSTEPVLARPLAGGDWSTLGSGGAQGAENCDDVLSLVAIRMPSDPTVSTGTIDITTERETACAGCYVPAEAPACPVGTWAISNAEVASMLQGWFDEDYAAIDYGDSATVEAVLGEVTLSLTSDGNAAWDFSGFEYNIEYVTPDLPFPVGIQVIGNGLVPGRWGAAGGQLRWCPADVPVEWVSRVDMQAMGVHEVPFPAPLPESHWYLSCGGDSMTLDYIGPIDMGRDDVHWTFSRRE